MSNLCWLSRKIFHRIQNFAANAIQNVQVDTQAISNNGNTKQEWWVTWEHSCQFHRVSGWATASLSCSTGRGGCGGGSPGLYTTHTPLGCLLTHTPEQNEERENKHIWRDGPSMCVLDNDSYIMFMST